MSVIHSQKTLHSLKASNGYLSGVYEAFTVMCELQEHTDLTLVTSDGKAFGVHKVSSTLYINLQCWIEQMFQLIHTIIF